MTHAKINSHEPSIRVFVSYSHDDKEFAEEIVKILEEKGLTVMWDKDFVFGHDFADMIKAFISYSHVFLPIITEASGKRGWVQQEIGYAAALNVPFLPIVIGALPGEMLHGLQAINLETIGDLNDQLSTHHLNRLISKCQDSSLAMYQCADEPEDRAKMMAQYADDLLAMEVYGTVRQMGGLSSFHIPDKGLSHQVWSERYGPIGKSSFHSGLQKKEREALQAHADAQGCRIIINPYLRYKKYGPKARRVRLETLLEFLNKMPDEQVEIAFKRDERVESLTMVGDWFVAESVSIGGLSSYRQTIFTRHAPTIRKKVESFDEEFEVLLEDLGWTKQESRTQAIKTINRIISRIH